MNNDGSARLRAGATDGQAKIVVILLALAVVLGVGAYLVGIKIKQLLTQDNRAGESNIILGESTGEEGRFGFEELRTDANKVLSWKTYRNETLGFELKYSPDWFVREEKPPEYSSDGVSFYTKDKGGRRVFSFGESGYEKIYSNLDEYILSLPTVDFEGGSIPKPVLEKDILVAGYPARQEIRMSTGAGIYLLNTFFIKDGKVFYVRTELPNRTVTGGEEETIDLVNTILSTIKFIR